MRTRFILPLVSIAVMGTALLAVQSANTIPPQYNDVEFWRMVNDFSEPDGQYNSQNYTSNEISYQNVLPELKRLTKPGGVYLGVGPEQNFTYVAALKPKVAFVVDIRRQNMLVHLMYKALFEIAPDRVEFVSKLFSRRKPTGLGPKSSVEEILQAYLNAPSDRSLYTETLQAIKDRLMKQHQFKPVGDDERKLESLLDVFSRGGPMMEWGFGGVPPNNTLPSYWNLLTATDVQGRRWSYLASEENYAFVREMQQKNLIVPVVGDFAGPKAIKAIGRYLKERGAVVSVFYISNVEDYIEPTWDSYVSNIKSLPQDDSSIFLRFRTLQNSQLMWMRDVLPKWPGTQPLNQ